MAIQHRSDLEHLQQLMRRDRLRKFIALLLLSGLTGTAIYAQAIWVLALGASGLVGGTAWQRQRARRTELNHLSKFRTTGR